MTKLMIRKSEKCLSCVFLAHSEEVDDELEIVCSKELDGYEDDGIDSDDTCPEYRRDLNKAETDVVESVYTPVGSVFHEKKEVTMDTDIEKADEQKHNYTFVGNSLVESKRGDLVLPGGLADAWNAKVADMTQQLEEEIDRLKGSLSEKITTAQQQLAELGEREIELLLVDDLFETEEPDELEDDHHEDEDLFDDDDDDYDEQDSEEGDDEDEDDED